MLKSMLYSAITPVSIAVGLALFGIARERETDAANNPALRYLFAPYIALAPAIVSAIFAVYQWQDPANQLNPENLILMSYIPAAYSGFSLCLAAYFYTFCAVLREDTILVSRWPLGTARFNLCELDQIKTDGKKNVILLFAGRRKFSIHGAYSGRNHFLRALNSRPALLAMQKNE